MEVKAIGIVSTISSDSYVEVVLRYFHRCLYRSSPLWFFCWRGLWSLGHTAMNECSGHEDLCGSGCQSVIPYIHGRTELYCSSLYEPEPFFPTPVKRCLSGPFIAQGRIVTMRSRARQVAPRWLKPYTTSRVLMARSS
jgi:hypothetical protein